MQLHWVETRSLRRMKSFLRCTPRGQRVGSPRVCWDMKIDASRLQRVQSIQKFLIAKQAVQEASQIAAKIFCSGVVTLVKLLYLSSWCVCVDVVNACHIIRPPACLLISTPVRRGYKSLPQQRDALSLVSLQCSPTAIFRFSVFPQYKYSMHARRRKHFPAKRQILLFFATYPFTRKKSSLLR